jgi:hypothetical protein
MRAEERQVRIRARPAARKRWEEAARRPREEVVIPSAAPHRHPAPARAVAPTLEEKLQALEKLVDGLGVARPLPHPAGAEHRTEAASTLERLLTH